MSKFLFYSAIFISGGVILVLEIIGSRLIIPFFGNTIFVWSSMLSATLTGLSLGYWLGGKIADKFSDFKLFYGLVATAGLLINILLRFKRDFLVLGDYFGVELGPLVSIGFLFLPVFFIFGILSPFAVRLKSRLIEKTGSTSGNIFAFSTLGSLLGALLSGFLFIRFSTIAVVHFSSLLLIFLGGLGFFLHKEKISNKILLIFSVLSAMLIFPPNQFQKEFSKVVLESEMENFYGKTRLIRFKGTPVRCLLIDNFIQGCLDDSGKDAAPYTQKMAELGNIHKSPQNILILGFGLGSVLKNLPESIKSSANFDIVEINKDVIQPAILTGFHQTPNQHLIIDDARRFLRKTKKQYDLIFMDVFGGGTSLPPFHLFNKEVFLEMKRALNPGGFIIVNIIGKTQDDPLTASLAFTFGHVFEKSFYFALNPERIDNIIFLAIKNGSRASDIGVSEIRHLHTGRLTSLRSINEIAGGIEKPILLTEDKNPIELLGQKNLKNTHQNLKKFLGQDFLLY